jgi:hypothetical protein
VNSCDVEEIRTGLRPGTTATWRTWLYVAGKDESGKVTSWSFKMGSPNGLVHRGWRRTELKKGDQVTVEGYGAKDGSNMANAGTVTIPDGRKLFGGFHTTPGAPVKQPRFSVTPPRGAPRSNPG